MARQISTVSAVASGTTQAVLTLAYVGTYDGGNNSVQCGGGSGQVYTAVYKRDVTGGGSFVLVTTLAGGTTGATGYTVTGLTDGRTWDFQAVSYQRREAYDGVNEVCVPADTGLASATSNQISTPPARIDAQPYAFALGAQAAGLSAGRNLTSAAGAYALSAQVTGLVWGRSVMAEPAAFGWTARDAVLAQAGRMGAAASEFALVGCGTVLRRGFSLPVEASAFALDGYSARLSFWGKAQSSDGGWTPGSAEPGDWTTQANTPTPWAPL